MKITSTKITCMTHGDKIINIIMYMYDRTPLQGGTKGP